MKILFIAEALQDYLSDMTFHGLVSLGVDVVDYNELPYMWSKGYDPREQGLFYGHGFGLYSTLPGDGSQTDRSDITSKIKAKFFDYVIYGNPWRCMDLWNIVQSSYPDNKIIFLDGEDTDHVHPFANRYPYFKRELCDLKTKSIRHIGFSFPKQKCNFDRSNKTQVLATVIPYDKSTYIFTDESKYYQDYSRSLFGITCKKAGWDCFRHYEIISQGCFPLFFGLENCPAYTLQFMPKALLIKYRNIVMDAVMEPPSEIRALYLMSFLVEEIYYRIKIDEYQRTMDYLISYFTTYLTTEAMSSYLLREIKGFQ